MTCDPAISKRGAIRSSSTVILPSGPTELEDAVVEFGGGAENLRTDTRVLPTVLAAERRRQWPPTRVNILPRYVYAP